MSAERLLTLRSELNNLGIQVWIDGGWGIDALLEEETRSHKDMDFIADKRFYDDIRSFFFSKGYKVSEDEPDTEWHFLLEGPDGEIVDVMLVGFLEEGGATYPPAGEGVTAFPAYAFEGKGKINSKDVECISAEYRLLCLTKDYGVVGRTGYVFNEKDYNDLKAISDKFNITMPPEFEEAKANGFPENN
jgi:lincosamide nucleotidyltransferase A/C/D/E